MPIQPNWRDLNRAESGSKYTSGSVSLGAVDGTTDLPDTTKNDLFLVKDLAFRRLARRFCLANCHFPLPQIGVLVPPLRSMAPMNHRAFCEHQSNPSV